MPFNIYVFRGLPETFWQSGTETANFLAIPELAGSKSRSELDLPGSMGSARTWPLHVAAPSRAPRKVQFWAPPKPFMAWVMPLGLSMIWEKRTTVTVSSTETVRS